MKTLSRSQEIWKQFRKNKGALIGLTIIIFFTLVAILSPVISPHDSAESFTEYLRIPPLWDGDGHRSFILGTDDIGRDILSRLIHGSQVSLMIGLSVVFISMISGVTLGLISGFYGGLKDRIIMRFMDILMSLPSILLAIVVVAVLGPGIENTILAVSIVAIPNFTRIVRAAVLEEKNKEYIIAARASGATPVRIILKEILPNCMAPIIVQSSLGFSDGILNAAALGFLGLGAQPPLPEWGIMLADSRAFIESSPWMVTLPGICILLMVLAFNIVGDGLRDAFDPKSRR